VPNAIRENHARQIVAAGKHRGKIAAFVAAGGHGDDIALQSRQLQRAVSSLITGPQFHAAEGPHRGSRAIKLFGFDPLVLHANFDASGTFQGADIAKEPEP
jgi:hypothetical protein